MRFSVWQTDTYAVSLRKPHADTQGFLNDYIWLAGLSTITGGAGADSLTGGTGADQFVYLQGVAVGAVATAAQVNTANGLDTITDFSVGQGDALGVVNLLRTALGAAAAEVFVTTLNGAAAGAANVIVISAIQGGGAALAAAAIEDLYTPGSTNGGSGVILVNNNGTAQLWYDADLDTDGAGATMTQIGTLTGLDLATAGVAAANFV